jgi:hypothetical protein
MFDVKTQPQVVIPLTEGTVFVVQGPASMTKMVVLENLDQANTMTYKFQFSDDGTIYTDVAAFTTLAPGAAVHVDLTAHVFHRLRAFGDLLIAVEVGVQMPFNAAFNFFNL